MAQVDRSADASVTSETAMYANITSYPAGTDLAACTPVYLDANYKWQKTNGTAANALAICWGFTLKAAKAGQVANVGTGTFKMFYNTGLTKDANLYVHNVAGELSDVATVGGTKVVAKVIDAQRGLIQTVVSGMLV